MTLSLGHYVLFGLIFWAILAFDYIGADALFYCLFASLPIVCALFYQTRRKGSLKEAYRSSDLMIAAYFFVPFEFLDALFGRQNLSNNVFIHGNDAVDVFVSKSVDSMGQGRGFFEIIGSICVFLPFMGIGVFKSFRTIRAIAFLGIGASILFYEVGVGRALFAMSAMAIIWPQLRTSASRASAVLFGFGLFNFISFMRGDLDGARDESAMEAGIYWPLRNLELLVNKGCANLTSIDYLYEFFKKFIPSQLFEKYVFSFNLEMTKCIYNFADSEIPSVSIFTYLGEIIVFQPSELTAMIAGSILVPFILLSERFFSKYNLPSLRIFSGLLTIALLRSRFQDLFTFYLFLLIFIGVCELIRNANARVQSTLEDRRRQSSGYG